MNIITMNIIQKQDNFMTVAYNDSFWQNFADKTRDEDWDETISRMNSEGIEVQMIWLNGVDDEWPDGLWFDNPKEKLKFILKYSG
jgi:hypothetical protein